MTKRKKIAIFHCGFVYSGGGERIVLEEAKGLIKRGHTVLVYAPTLDREKCFPELVRELNVKAFFPSIVDRLPLRNAIRMVAASILAPLIAINFRDVDVFIGANQPGAWIAFCISKVLKKPYIVYLNQPNRVVYPRDIDLKHGWYTTHKDYHFLFVVLRFFKILVAGLDRLSIRSAGSILVNGGYIGGVIENIYAKETVPAPAGASYSAWSKIVSRPERLYQGRISIAGRKIKKPYCLITNRHDPQKRFDYVIEAFSKVLKTFPKANLVIPGPFTVHTAQLLKLTKKLKIESKVYFLGQIPESELQKLYQYCTVYCYPSPEEDFGLGPLEAGGWAVPTVAWNHAGPTVTVEDEVTGFLAKPYDVDDYAKKMLTLLKNPKLRSKMGRAAWERTKNNFSWDKHVDTVEESLKNL